MRKEMNAAEIKLSKTVFPQILEIYGLEIYEYTKDLSKEGKFFLPSGSKCWFHNYNGEYYWQCYDDPWMRGDALDLLCILEPNKSKGAILDRMSQIIGTVDTTDFLTKGRNTHTISSYSVDESYNTNCNTLNSALKMNHNASILASSLRSRGIEIESLPPAVREKICLINYHELLSKNGHVSKNCGVVFALGKNGSSFKIRLGLISDGKFEYSKGGNRFRNIGPSELFLPEYIEQTDGPIFITEAEFDALSIISLGYPAVAVPGVTNFKKVMKELYAALELWCKFPSVVLAFDADEAGMTHQMELSEELSRAGVPFTEIHDMHGAKDINELLIKNRDALKAELDICAEEVKVEPDDNDWSMDDLLNF